ncbi:MAG: Asp-tRNA(Asn)/Glu-tRNA(Gln) amidotransferase subunit GatA [Desulfobacteraceae bacterium]|nr:Asp-tRNA(Asn)/Glu-tRNA(Gln) amidotransferase subunit GatA [Desulfobacteraceae bacterium]
MDQLHSLSLTAALALLDKGEVSAVDLTRAVLARIDAVEDRIGAYITLSREHALTQAQEADRGRHAGTAGPLCGLPISIKDVLCTRGLRTTCGSRILESFVPPYDATVVARLRAAGAVLVGKTNMDEFAMGSSNESSAFGPARNPWQTSHICGGSSGGSAAAVAAGECLASIGTDTGGSIRQPASHCGVVGLKPTYGRVSRYGLVAFASSLDQAGPLTKTVEDAALLLGVIAGHDPKDSTSVDRPVPDYRAALTDGLKGLTLGIPKEYFAQGLDPEVEAAVRHGIEVLREAGADTVDISLPHTEYGVAAYYLIAPAEASSNLARFDGVRYGLRDKEAGTLYDMYRRSRSRGFGSEVKRRIIIGTYALSSGYYDAYYRKASQVRALIGEDFRKAFARCDALVSPVSPIPAWKLGEKAADPLSMYLTDVLTIPNNLAGLPGISVPCGFSGAGLPIGLQVQAAHFEEEKLLRIAANLERRLGIVGRRPELANP